MNFTQRCEITKYVIENYLLKVNNNLLDKMKKINKLSLPSLICSNSQFPDELEITTRSLVINISDEPIKIRSDNSMLNKFESTILQNTFLESLHGDVIIFTKGDNKFIQFGLKLRSEVKNKWTRTHKLFPEVPVHKKITMYRSPKVKLKRYEVNLWFLSKDTSGRIHKEHDFLEIHTQIVGMGMMQKFHTQERNTLFQSVILSPGQTHKPFYNQLGEYPWHSYDSVTDCIWLAIEEH